MNGVTGYCLDALGPYINQKAILYRCLGKGGYQFFAFAKSGQIVTVFGEEFCLGIYDRFVILVRCHELDKTQLWTYNHKVSDDKIEITKRNQN